LATKLRHGDRVAVFATFGESGRWPFASLGRFR
jgi:hypothetical protein